MVSLVYSGASALVNKLLALRFPHDGASEIYLDGQQIGAFGKVGCSERQMQAFAPIMSMLSRIPVVSQQAKVSGRQFLELVQKL